MNNSHSKDISRHAKTKSSTVVSSNLQQVKLVTVTENDENQRIDNFLFKICKGVPKSHVYRILRSGEVRVNKGRIDQTYRLKTGDVVRIPPMQIAEKTVAHIPKGQFDILFEDAHLLIINKPAGTAVHGGSGVSYGIIEQLRATRPHEKFLELVHRLDRETSGVLVLAKKRSALVHLHKQIRAGTVDKRYQTLVHGQWKHQRQHVRLPLRKYLTPEGERRVRVQEDGMVSYTIFNLMEQFEDFTLLEAELKTGRTHQIRVHLASSGFVIAGDDKYGNFELNRELQKAHKDKGTLKRMFLHAYQITFTHPESQEKITLTVPLPPDCASYLQSLQTEKKKPKSK